MCWYNTSRFWPYKWQVCVSKTSWHVIVTWLHFHAEQEHLKSFIWYEAQRQSLTRPAEAVWDTHWLRLGCVSLGARQMDGAEELISLAFWKECVMGQCQALWPTTFTCPFCHPKPALSELLSAPLYVSLCCCFLSLVFSLCFSVTNSLIHRCAVVRIVLQLVSLS